ncbi:MAG: NAD(P)/FAD-dependent oxidoreductase [Xanthobacteraceae bacterium]
MTSNSPPAIAIIGAGPAGLMAAEVASSGGARVTVYDRMPSVGRKFLMAGRGGLNLTHSEPLQKFLSRYPVQGDRLRHAIEAFPPTALRAWAEDLGEATFVGSSGRVFPKAMKASPLLRRWLRRLSDAGVTFKLRHHWIGWDDRGDLLFDTPDGRMAVPCDATVLALGGASWPRLGSAGDWVAPLASASIAVTPLTPANCGFTVNWSEIFRTRFEGQPLKRIALAFGDIVARGEVMITHEGLEGGAIYALSGPLRQQTAAYGEALLHIDLRPEISHTDLATRLARPRGKQSLATFLRKSASLPPAAIGLLHEAMMRSSQQLSSLPADALAKLIKAVPVQLTGIAPIARAISTAGGISLDDVDEHFMLRRRPGVFIAGEMLDFDAPTGGYLLQAAFATGVAAGKGVLQYLKNSPLWRPHQTR